MSNLMRVVVLASLVICVFVGYCWYVLAVQANKIVAALAPQLQIHYDFVRVSPLGWASLENIEVNSPKLPDKILIDAVRFEPHNPFGLLNVARALQREEWPKTLRLRIENATFDLYGAAYKERNIAPSYDSMGCNDVAAVSLDVLRGMEYRVLRFDGVVQYNVNEFINQLSTSAKFEAKNMVALTLNANFQIPPSRNFLQIRLTPPQLKRAELVVQDQSFNQLKSQLCANKIGIPVEAFFAENTLQATRVMRSRGLSFSQDLVSAYRNYIATEGRIVIEAEPEEAINLMDLPELETTDLLDKLQLAVQVNEQEVADISVRFHSPERLEPEFDFAAESVPATGQVTNSEPGGPGGPPLGEPAFLTLPTAPASAGSAVPGSPNPEFLTIDPNAVASQSSDWFTLIPPAQRAFQTSSVGLAAYIDRMVVVTLADGRQHKGQLTTVGNRDLQLMMEVQRGTVGFSIAFENIQAVRVLP